MMSFWTKCVSRWSAACQASCTVFGQDNSGQHNFSYNTLKPKNKPQKQPLPQTNEDNKKTNLPENSIRKQGELWIILGE